MPLGTSDAPGVSLTASKAFVTFGTSPPRTWPAKVSSGAYCTASSAAQALAVPPPE